MVAQKGMLGGWLEFELANHCRAVHGLLLPEAVVRQQPIDPDRTARAVASIKPAKASLTELVRHHALAGMLIGGLERAYARFAHAETLAHQASLACALERYRLAHGQYPDSLDLLMPAWVKKLPADVITGSSVRSRRGSDGRFVAWSVGWDGQDNDGQGSERPDGPDWVWEPLLKRSQ